MPSDLFEMMKQTNQRKVHLFERNHDVAAFVDGLIEHLVNYADHKGIPFEAIRITAPFVGDNEIIQAQITVDPRYGR